MLQALEKIEQDWPAANVAAWDSQRRWIRGQARPKQRTPEGDWETWLILAGRGWGKTLTGAKDLVAYAALNPESICAVVAPTAGDLRRVCFDGPSGILSVIPEPCLWHGHRKGYNRGTSEVTLWNGSIIQGFAAIEPDRLRGPQFHRAWADELAAWRYEDAWDQLQFGLRLGDNPQAVVTTTPRPTPIIRQLVKDGGTELVTGSTFENEANLAPKALAKLKEKYEGTRLGRQELHAEILDDTEGALWKRAWLDDGRVRDHPDLVRIVVAIDPSTTKTKTSDECGMIIAAKGKDGHCYILEDLSAQMTPNETAVTAVENYHLWEADRIVAEANNGGDWIELGLRQIDRNVAYSKLHASRGKQARAEPVAALYEQRRVHHVGAFPAAEDELCTWEPNTGMASPNRLDAIVWAVTELMLKDRGIKLMHVKA